MENKAPISFKSYRIEKIKYEKISDEKVKNEAKLNGEITITDDHKEGLVRQKVTVYNKERNRKLQVNLIASFEIVDTNLNEEQINILLARNGSAMLYPYTRTIVSIISSLDSSVVVNLPSLNFTDAYISSEHDE